MPNDSSSPSPPPDTSTNTPSRSRDTGWRLWLVKGSLVLILLGMSIVGHRNGIWPVINWPMYSRLFEAHPPTVSALRVDVVPAEGEPVPFLMREIAPIGEHKMVAGMIHCSQQAEAAAIRARCIRALEALARWNVPDRPLDAIEFWKVEWAVDLLALPPIVREAPTTQRLIGRLPLAPTSAPSSE